MKVIGIIGGMGPFASIELHRQILLCSEANKDQEYPSIIHLSLSNEIVDRSEFLLNESQINPGEALANQVKYLIRLGCSVFTIACNTANHSLIINPILKVLAENPNILYVSILDVTKNTLFNLKGSNKVGLLATLGSYKTNIFQDYVKKEIIYPSFESQLKVHEAIYHPTWGIKACKDFTPEALAQINLVINELLFTGCDKIILGCTELCLPTNKLSRKKHLINPINLLAQKLIDVSAEG